MACTAKKRPVPTPTVEELERDLELMQEDREALHAQIEGLMRELGRTRARNVLLCDKLDQAKMQARHAKAALLILVANLENDASSQDTSTRTIATQRKGRKKVRR